MGRGAGHGEASSEAREAIGAPIECYGGGGCSPDAQDQGWAAAVIKGKSGHFWASPLSQLPALCCSPWKSLHQAVNYSAGQGK